MNQKQNNQESTNIRLNLILNDILSSEEELPGVIPVITNGNSFFEIREIAKRLAVEKQIPVLILTNEDEKTFVGSLLAVGMNVAPDNLNQGKLTETEWSNLIGSVKEFSNSPIFWSQYKYHSSETCPEDIIGYVKDKEIKIVILDLSTVPISKFDNIIHLMSNDLDSVAKAKNLQIFTVLSQEWLECLNTKIAVIKNNSTRIIF